jgi:hypothetical protein
MKVAKVGVPIFRSALGAALTPALWADAVKAGVDTVGLDLVKVNGEDAHVWTRYSGFDHDGTGTVWELGVTDSEHGGYHLLFTTRAAALSAHGKVVTNLKAGKAPGG